ncbi:MAG TPA: hypothetical protein VMD99_12265 [Terriglobales bacterium]|nr:hypothetical protein [Terriglobales bacterium]
MLDKLDGIGGNSIPRDQLGNNPRRDLDTAIVLYFDDGADLQLSIQLDGCPVLIQVGGFGRDGKGSFVPVLTRQSYRAVEGNPGAPALSQLNAIQAVRGR